MSFFKSTFPSNNSSSTLNSTVSNGGKDGNSLKNVNSKNDENGNIKKPIPKKSLTYILNVNNDTENQMRGHHSIGVNSLLYNKSDKCLISGGRDGQISIWKFDKYNNNESTNLIDDNVDIYDNFRTSNEIRNHILTNLDNETEFKNLENSINNGVSSVCVSKSKKLPKYYKHSYLHHFGWINDMKLLADQQTIVSCSNDLSIKLWNYNSNMKLTLGYHDDYIKKIGFSQKFNNQLVSGGLDKILKIWDIQKCKPISSYKFKDFNSSIYSLDTNNNNLIICSGPSNIITLFDRRDIGKPIKTFLGHTDNVRSLILKDDTFLSGSSDSTIKLWDLRSTRILRNFEMHNSPIWSLKTPAYSDNFSIFYSADKSGLLLKTDLRSSIVDSKNISGGYFNYKVNESSGISTVIVNVNFTNNLQIDDSNSITTNNLENSLTGINDIIECEDLGTIWTATASNIHNSNTNFINSWSIPQTGKLVAYQGLVLNRKLASLYNNNNNNDSNNNNNNNNNTATNQIPNVEIKNDNDINFSNKIKVDDNLNDTEDLVSLLSGDDLNHIDNALFSNSGGLDEILKTNSIDMQAEDELISSLSSDMNNDLYQYSTCFVGFLGNLNTQFLFADDQFDLTGEEEKVKEREEREGEGERDDDESLDPFSNDISPIKKSNKIRVTRSIEINNDCINEDDVLLLPFNVKPISTISGVSGLIKCKILNNRRHVATMDQQGCVYIFDILLGKLIHRVDKNLSINSIESIEKGFKLNESTDLKNSDTLNLSDRFEAVCEKFQTQETLPTWCSVQVKSGQLFITLNENNFTSCEIYSDDFFEFYEDIRHQEGSLPVRINLGKCIIKSFFDKLMKSVIINRDIANLTDFITPQLMNSQKNNSINIVSNNSNNQTTVKIPQPTPSTRKYSGTPNIIPSPTATEKSKRGGLFGRLKSNKKDSINNNSTSVNLSKRRTGDNKLDIYLNKINHIDNTRDLFKFIENNNDVLSILRTQDGYDERERENAQLPVFEYPIDEPTQEEQGKLTKQKDDDISMLIVINEETRHETRPAFKIHINELLNGNDDEREEIVMNLPIWISKGLLLNLYPISTSTLNKIGFVVVPEESSGLSKIQDGESSLRLNAMSTLRVSRVLEFVQNKLPEKERGHGLELLCRGQVLAEKDTLGTVKARIWKAGGDVVLAYRIK
jgi:WD40 repeat protein